MRILVFGDSIAQGYWDTEYGGWVQRLRRQYDQKQVQNFSLEQPLIFNLGISGDTTEVIAKRLTIETGARRWFDDPILIVIATGLNDSQIKGSQPLTTPELYKSYLQQIISETRQYTDSILFIGLTACDESRTKPVSWGDYTFTNDRILKFERILRDFCQENELPVVKVFEKFQDKNIKKNLLTDGLHPNAAGHQLIAELVKPELDKLIQG